MTLAEEEEMNGRPDPQRHHNGVPAGPSSMESGSLMPQLQHVIYIAQLPGGANTLSNRLWIKEIPNNRS